MPQYAEPLSIRTTQTVLDVIRDYPGYSPGCRRWDDRVFHPDQSADSEQPVSALWKAPPAFIDRLAHYQGALLSASEVSMSCRVECDPPCSIQWYRNDEPIIPNLQQ